MTIFQPAIFSFPVPSMEQLDVTRVRCRTIDHKTASDVVNKYHYAHRTPSIVVAIGMYVDGELAGVITYGMPAAPHFKAFSDDAEQHVGHILELNRLFVHDWCGKNSESYLIGQSFKILQSQLPQYYVLVSYSDTGMNHLGSIYQATNWIYTGITDECGNFSKIEIKGKERTSKSFYDELGSQSRHTILKHYPDAIFHKYTVKHRYIIFLGDKKRKKELLSNLRWTPLPYPKREIL